MIEARRRAVQRSSFAADLRRPGASLRRVAAVLAWEMRWAIRRSPLLLILMQFAAAAQIVLQGAVVFLLRSGLDGPESGRAATIALTVLCLAASIVAGFVFRRSTNRLAVQFETDMAKTAVDVARTKTAPETCGAIVFPGTRFAGRSLGIALIAVANAASVLVLFAVSLTLDPLLTVVVTALVLPTLLIHLVLNRRVHRNASDRRARSAEARLALRDALSRTDGDGGSYVASRAYREQRTGYEKYIGTSAFADLTSGISIILGIAFAAFWLFLREGAAPSAVADATSQAVAILLYLQAVGGLLRSTALFMRLFGRAEAVWRFVTMGIITETAVGDDDDEVE